MKTTKKALLAVVCAAALVFGSVFATYAYLTDKTDVVTNTFTVGNVGITLTETTGEEYKMVPGVAIDKDPIVTVEKGSEDCWVFLKVDEVNNANEFLWYAIDSNNWTKLEGNIYYTKYKNREDVDIAIKVLAGGSETEKINGKDYTVSWEPNQVATKASVTKKMMDALTDTTLPQLKFTAYAVQYAGFEDKPADAWAVIPDEEKA